MTRALPSRKVWVLVHRWAGLSLALFLAIAGLTGMALAWEDELEAWSAPGLLLAAPPVPGARAHDPVELRALALARHPGMVADFLPLTIEPGHSLRLRVSWRDPAHAQGWDELFIDPYTTRELGHRHWGDITEGQVNLLPFLYLLHYTLLLGPAGRLVMGLAALVWTLDCFVGFYLTLPVRLKKPSAPIPRPVRRTNTPPGWWKRWKPSWQVRWRASGHKLTFDLHRAGGLWIWLALLVFAWSSVSFNLRPVYTTVMGVMGASDRRADLASLAASRPVLPRPMPALSFAQAAARGAQLARNEDALPHAGARWLWHVPASGVYVYGFTTRADIPDEGGGSQIAFDDRTGVLRLARPAARANLADRLTDWIVALHMARAWGSVWQVLVTIIGACVAMLSVTGVLIWWKKRQARETARIKTRLRTGPNTGTIRPD